MLVYHKLPLLHAHRSSDTYHPFCAHCDPSGAFMGQCRRQVLLMLLVKSNLLRVKMSLLGSLVGLVLLAGFLATTGLLTAVSAGSIAYALRQKKTRAQTV